MDKESFVKELEASSSMMYRIAWSILRNDDDCKDALQETVLKAWTKRDRLRDEKFFRTWITRILINTCYDTQKKRRCLVSIDEITEPAIPPHNPELHFALEALPEKLRIPLVLCYSEGMSYEEIGQVLRLPLSTVRGRIHRGKEQLRKDLSDNDACNG